MKSDRLRFSGHVNDFSLWGVGFDRLNSVFATGFCFVAFVIFILVKVTKRWGIE